MIIVGERINSSRVKIAEAIKKKDSEFIRKEAIMQVEAGARMVDVNVGTFVAEEPEYLKWIVQTIQEAIDVPLCLDSPNPAAITAGLAVHKGKALLNSITAQKDRFDGMMPLAKKYRCSVVALCVNDRGIPDTAEERFQIASHLIQNLTGEGIPRDDIYVDPVVSPISTDAKSARAVLDTIERVGQAFKGVHVICGLSNVSFGLPLRKQINQMFLVMAMARRLDAVIMDPCDARIMANLLTAKALLGDDDYCLGYITAYREGKLNLVPKIDCCNSKPVS